MKLTVILILTFSERIIAVGAYVYKAASSDESNVDRNEKHGIFMRQAFCNIANDRQLYGNETYVIMGKNTNILTVQWI